MITEYDYTTRYKDILLQQFKDSENLNEIFRIKGLYRNERQALILSVIENFLIDSAIGEQLDVIGRIVVFDRGGRSDNNYRTLLKIKIKINNSEGQPETFIQAVRELFDASFVKYKQIETEPAQINILQDGTINLVDEYELITEDDYNLQYDSFDEWFLTTEDDYEIVTDSLENLIVYDTGSGGNLIVTEPDDIDESILYDIIPAGVGITFLEYLVTEEEEYLITEEREIIMI